MLSYELSDEAEIDLDEVTEYTHDKHGLTQTLKYVDVNLPHFIGQFVKTVFIHFLKHYRCLKLVS